MTLNGMAGHCRAWLPGYAQGVQPLADLIYGHKMAVHDLINWTPEATLSLTRFKQLRTSPCLGLPDHEKVFNIFVFEKDGFMSSVLTRDHGGKQRPVAYYSKKFDSFVRWLLCCLRAVASAYEALLACADIVTMCPLTVHVPHIVQTLISQAKTVHRTPARPLHYQNVLLTMSHVTLKRCTVFVPAILYCRRRRMLNRMIVLPCWNRSVSHALIYLLCHQ